MRVAGFTLAAGLAATAAAASSAKAPACVNKCWEYTQYVSTCGDDTACLCDDAEYQNAVYQCLYSQCPTAYFANALHHTLAICSSGQTETDAPALIRQEGLKNKRQDAPAYYGAPAASSSMMMMSGSVAPGSASVTRSAPMTRGSASVSYSAPATRGSPGVSGSVAPTGASSRANPTATGAMGGNGGNGGSAPAPTFTGAAAIAGSSFGAIAAGVAALAALA